MDLMYWIKLIVLVAFVVFMVTPCGIGYWYLINHDELKPNDVPNKYFIAPVLFLFVLTLVFMGCAKKLKPPVTYIQTVIEAPAIITDAPSVDLTSQTAVVIPETVVQPEILYTAVNQPVVTETKKQGDTLRVTAEYKEVKVSTPTCTPVEKSKMPTWIIVCIIAFIALVVMFVMSILFVP